MMFAITSTAQLFCFYTYDYQANSLSVIVKYTDWLEDDSLKSVKIG